MQDAKKNIKTEVLQDEILFAYIRGTATPEEIDRVESWLDASEANEELLMQTARLYFAWITRERMEARRTKDGLLLVKRKIKQKKLKRQFFRLSWAAACLAGLLFLSSLFFFLYDTRQPVDSQWFTVESNPGIRTHFTLPDGTVVSLNAGSTLRYPVPYDRQERKVALEGEAYFQVTHRPEQPFIVGVLNDQIAVKVLGTEFNVEAYTGERMASTTLVKGKVQLLWKNRRGQACEQLLSPAEKAVYRVGDETCLVRKVDPTSETAWRTGKIVFNDTPLPEVLRKLTHFYDVEFKVEDAAIRAYRFTGTFDNRPLTRILDYLKISSGIDYTFCRMVKDDSCGITRHKVILRKK